MSKRTISDKRRMLVFAVILVVILIASVLICEKKLNNKEDEIEKVTSESEEIKTNIIAKNEVDMDILDNVVIEDEVKENVSKNIKRVQTVDNLTYNLENLSATKDEVRLTLRVRNRSKEEFSGSKIKITFFDKDMNEYGTLNSYVGKIGVDEEKEINITTTLDVTNAYDYKISKVE